jgi:hypothetical protein
MTPAHGQVEVLLSPPVPVQEPAPQPLSDGSLPNPQSIQQLAEGLKWIVWNESSRGPLLAVGSDTTPPYQPKRENPLEPWRPPDPLSPPEYRKGWRVETIATYFGRKVNRVGSLSVLAPTLMTVLNTHLPDKSTVDPFAHLHSYEKMQLFESSLTEDQWRKMATDEGLGAADLDAEQRDLFLGLIPENSQLSKTVQRARWAEGVNLTDLTDLDPVNRQGKLSSAQRMGARLRINRSVHLWLPDAENGNVYGAWVPEHAEGTETWALNNPGDWMNRAEAYGVPLTEDVPAKQKPSDLDYASPDLDVEIVLGQAKNIGELIKRVSDATHLELFADGRLNGLTLWTNAEDDETVRAGDLLRALSLAVTGTYRRVGPAYVLTDDLEGIGTRRARIQEWVDSLNRIQNKSTQDLWRRLQKMNVASFVQYAPGDDLTLNDTLNAKLEQQQQAQRSGEYQPPLLSTSDLPARMQKLVQSAVRAHDQDGLNNPEQHFVASDMVHVQIEVKTSLIIPGIGAVDFQMGGMNLDAMRTTPREHRTSSGRSADLPVILPENMATGGVLLLTPEKQEDVDLAIDTVRQVGFRQLWVYLPTDPIQGKELLTAAIKAGKERHIPVYAVLRLMQIPRTKEKTDKTLITILGETSSEYVTRKTAETEAYPGQMDALRNREDWLNPADPATLPFLKQRILQIAAIPGLAGVVLCDIAVPGYEHPGTNNGFDWSPFPTGELGYSLENRLGLLREAGYDPIDIPVSSGYSPGVSNINLPFFTDRQQTWIRKPNGEWGPDDKLVTPNMSWAAYRFKKSQKLMADLYKAVRDEKPDLQLFASSLGTTWNNNSYFLWDAPEKILAGVPLSPESPNHSPTNNTITPTKQLLRIDCSAVVSAIRFYTTEENITEQILFNRNVNQMLDWRDINRMGQKWDGFVLDFSNTPVKDMMPLVLAGIQPSGNQTAEK